MIFSIAKTFLLLTSYRTHKASATQKVNFEIGSQWAWSVNAFPYRVIEVVLNVGFHVSSSRPKVDTSFRAAFSWSALSVLIFSLPPSAAKASTQPRENLHGYCKRHPG